MSHLELPAASRPPDDPREHLHKPVSHTYTRLNNAIQTVGSGDLINLYGVVKEFEQPRKTEGTKCIAGLTVVDMTYSNKGLRLFFFAKALDMLPQVAAKGDIIRIHCLELKQWESTIQGRVNLKVGGKAQYLLFDGQPQGNGTPYKHSLPNFEWEEQDDPLLSTLRSWGAAYPVNEGQTET